ncbi:hypothetical protein C0995_002768 [Termitomyces sp. Mi166|nr:hypothetical protein C0995_002768 [Termitomyces sp. Mi166\
MPYPPPLKLHFRFSSLADDSDSDQEVNDKKVSQRPRQVALRSSGACVHCKSLKVKCEFLPGESVCRRCQAGGHNCLARTRKKRKPAPYVGIAIKARAHHQDLQIQQLLLQFDKLKADNKIQESMTRAQSIRPPDIKKPTMYLMAMEFARDAAGRALIDGSKSVDVCQAYLLMAVYPIPKKKWAEDRSWLLMGVAIRYVDRMLIRLSSTSDGGVSRMAIELELNQPPPDTCSEREKLNRTRTWLNCYCVDGSHAIQFGKMPMLRLDDYLARHSREWYRLPMTLPYDVHLCAYVHIIIIVAEFRAIMANEAESQELDVVSLALRTEGKLSHELSGWVEIYAQEFSNLLVLAVGFQHAVKSDLSRDSQILQKSIRAAREVIQIMAERLYPTGNLRFAMGANFLYVSFAAAFLINLLRPTLLRLLDEKTQSEILQDVRNLIAILGSKDVAIDARHTPALYCRFLSSLLAKHHYVLPQVTSESPISDSSVTPFPNDGQFLTYSWPDIMYDVNKHDQQHDASSTGGLCQADEVDMDLSLSHFVRTPHMSISPVTLKD